MASFGFNSPVFQKGQGASTPIVPPAPPQQGFPQGYPGSATLVPPLPPQGYPASVTPGQQANIEGMYAAPSAGSHQTDRMTYEDTIWKTVGVFALLLVGAVIAFFATLMMAYQSGSVGGAMPLAIIAGLVGMGLGFANALKRKPSAILVLAYGLVEGVFIGALSATFELIYPGIIMQATLATLCVVGVTLALFASGKVRTSPKMTRFVMIAMGAYLLFSIANLVLTLIVPGLGWGMRSGPLGIIIGIVAVLMATYMLIMDFEFIKNGVENGAPRAFGWRAAFGIVSTVVWIYVEILRILAILRGNN